MPHQLIPRNCTDLQTNMVHPKGCMCKHCSSTGKPNERLLNATLGHAQDCTCRLCTGEEMEKNRTDTSKIAHAKGCMCSHCKSTIQRPANITLAHPQGCTCLHCTGKQVQRPTNTTSGYHPQGCTCQHCKALTPDHPLNCTCPHCTETHLKQTYNITLPSHPSHCTCPACTPNSPYNTTLPHPHNNTHLSFSPNHTHTKRLSPPLHNPLSPTALLAITIATLTLTAILIHTLTLIITKRRTASPQNPPTSPDLETASSYPYPHHPTLPPFKGGDLGSRPDHIHHYYSSYAATRVPGSFVHADADAHSSAPSLCGQYHDAKGGEQPPAWWGSILERFEEMDVADLRDVGLE